MIKLLCAIICLSSSAASCAPLVAITTWQADGAKVLYNYKPELPIVDIAVIFDAGSSQDHNAWGLAHFTNSMLDQGTQTLAAAQIATRFAKNGAQYSSGVDRDLAIVKLRSLNTPKLLAENWDTFTKIISEPIFPKHEFYQVRHQILATLAAIAEQPGALAENKLYAELYDINTYGHAPYGSKSSIMRLNPQSLTAFHKQFYTANNATIVIVGDITIPRAEKLVTQLTKKLPHTPKKLPPSPTLLRHPRSQNSYFPSTQKHIYIGQHGIAKNDPDFFPLLIGNFILGQAPLTSKLFQEVRNNLGLVYHISSNFITLKFAGPFFIYLQTSTQQAPKAITTTLAVLEKFIAQGITDEDLALAKESLLGQLPLSIASNAKITDLLSTIGFYNLPLNYLDTYMTNINAVTVEQVKQALKQHLKLENTIIIQVGSRTSNGAKI